MQPQHPGGYGQGLPFNPNMQQQNQNLGAYPHQQFQQGMAPPLPYQMQQQQPNFYPPNNHHQQQRPGLPIQNHTQIAHLPPQWQQDQVCWSAIRDIRSLLNYILRTLSANHSIHEFHRYLDNQQWTSHNPLRMLSCCLRPQLLLHESVVYYCSALACYVL